MLERSWNARKSREIFHQFLPVESAIWSNFLFLFLLISYLTFIAVAKVNLVNQISDVEIRTSRLERLIKNLELRSNQLLLEKIAISNANAIVPKARGIGMDFPKQIFLVKS